MNIKICDFFHGAASPAATQLIIEMLRPAGTCQRKLSGCGTYNSDKISVQKPLSPVYIIFAANIWDFAAVSDISDTIHFFNQSLFLQSFI